MGFPLVKLCIKQRRTAHLDPVSRCILYVDFMRPEIQQTVKPERKPWYYAWESVTKVQIWMIAWWLDLDVGLLLSCAHARTLKDLWSFIYLTGGRHHTETLKCHIWSAVVLWWKRTSVGPPLCSTLTTVGWVAVKLCTYIHDAQRGNPDPFFFRHLIEHMMPKCKCVHAMIFLPRGCYVWPCPVYVRVASCDLSQPSL